MDRTRNVGKNSLLRIIKKSKVEWKEVGPSLVIVPTVNETGNIHEIISRILDVRKCVSLDMEVIIVDDGSTDGTQEFVHAWEPEHPVRLLFRKGKGGLPGAVPARGVLLTLTDLLDWPSQVAILAAIGVAAATNYLGSPFFMVGNGFFCFRITRNLFDKSTAIFPANLPFIEPSTASRKGMQKRGIIYYRAPSFWDGEFDVPLLVSKGPAR